MLARIVLFPYLLLIQPCLKCTMVCYDKVLRTGFGQLATKVQTDDNGRKTNRPLYHRRTTSTALQLAVGHVLRGLMLNGFDPLTHRRHSPALAVLPFAHPPTLSQCAHYSISYGLTHLRAHAHHAAVVFCQRVHASPTRLSPVQSRCITAPRTRSNRSNHEGICGRCRMRTVVRLQAFYVSIFFYPRSHPCVNSTYIILLPETGSLSYYSTLFVLWTRTGGGTFISFLLTTVAHVL